MRHAIDQLHAFRSHVFCEGWFSGLSDERGHISILVDGREFEAEIVRVKRPDVAAAFGANAEYWGFRLCCRVDSKRVNWQDSISLLLSDGKDVMRVDDPATPANGLHKAAASEAELAFFSAMHAMLEPKVLEIGSRARSGNSKNAALPADVRYVGFDIADGENVDVVGDAHFLAEKLPEGHFDFVFSISTFEHLMMPWKVAIELNKVMKMGGMAFIHSHQTWPVHDAPWDFYRFSKFGWHGLFNHFTGFEVISSCHAEPATILSQVQINNPATFLEHQTGYLMSVCLIRKISPCRLTWDAQPGDIISAAYPA